MQNLTALSQSSAGNVTVAKNLTVEGTLSPLFYAVGTFSSATAGSGVPLAAATPSAFKVYSDDVGANVATSARGLLSRTLLTVDQSAGTIRALQGQLKLKDGVDVTTGIYTSLQGYVEMAATHVAKTGSTFSCIDASAEIGTALTVDSGGEFFGIHVETTGSGTITNSGTCAAIGITKASGAASWPVGLDILGACATTGIAIGSCTTGIAITNATLGVTAGRAIKIATSQAAAAMDDGYGVVEIDHTITGTAGSNFSGCALSAWVNIPSGTVGAGKYVCAQNNGIYEDSAATVTNARLIFGLRAQKLIGDTDSLSFPFSINTNNTAITALVDVNNATDMGWIDGVLSNGTGDGHIPLFRDNAGVVHYVNTYVA